MENELPAQVDDEAIRQVARWTTYLNAVFGLTAFSFAVASQGTPRPAVNAALSLIFILVLHFSVYRKGFPAALTLGRQLKGPVSRGLEKRTLGIKVLVLNLPAFWLGYFYLGLVAAAPHLGWGFLT